MLLTDESQVTRWLAVTGDGRGTARAVTGRFAAWRRKKPSRAAVTA